MNRKMTNNVSSRPAFSISHATLALSLMAGLLLLAGCGSYSVSGLEADQVARLGPVPPLRPASFADFDEHAHIPERIEIPSIGLDTQVVDLGWSEAVGPAGRIFNNWDVASFAAGWHVNSDQLGQGGNVVLSGHNNIQGAVFRKLDQLQAGDIATIWSGATPYSYEIDTVVIVPERDATHEQRLDNAKWIGEFDDDRITLVSCWPRDDNSHRIIAVGHLVAEDAN